MTDEQKKDDELTAIAEQWIRDRSIPTFAPLPAFERLVWIRIREALTGVDNQTAMLAIIALRLGDLLEHVQDEAASDAK